MIIRRFIATHSSTLVRRQQKKILANLDITSPPNPLLDTESLGRNVRETDFTLFPASSLKTVVEELVRNGKTLDLMGNLIQRAVDVLEQPDEAERTIMRKEFQSIIFSKWAIFFAKKTGYCIFSLFNRKTIEQVAPKIHRDKWELIVKLISQPILRILNLKGANLDPNSVMEYTGVDGFRSIMDRFYLDLRLLSGRNFDRLVDRMRSRHKVGSPVHFEVICVWFLVWSPTEHGLRLPPLKGSKWTLEKLLIEIDRKQSKHMLIELLGKCQDEVLRQEICGFLRMRHGFTGLPRYPWSCSVVDEWMVQLSQEEPQSIESNQMDIVPVIQNGRHDDLQDGIRQLVEVRVIDTDKELTRIKNEIFSIQSQLIGLSFVTDNCISISTDQQSYVIDLEAVDVSFIKYLLKRILSDSDSIKVVYSLEALLNRIQLVWRWDQGIHFENIVDLRRGRIKRSLGLKDSAESSACEIVLPRELSTDDASCEQLENIYEKTQHIYGGVPLSDLVQEHLGFNHNRRLVYENPELWSVRPLEKRLIMTAAHDSFYLVLLEKHFQKNGFKPIELLTHDPF